MTLDGLILDFVRHPPFFCYYDPLVEGFEKDYGQSPLNLAEDDDRWLRCRAAVMTDFLRQVRHKLDKAEKEKGKANSRDHSPPKIIHGRVLQTGTAMVRGGSRWEPHLQRPPQPGSV